MIWRRLLGYFPASLAGGPARFGAVFAQTTMGVIYTLSVTWVEAAAYRFAGEADALQQFASRRARRV